MITINQLAENLSHMFKFKEDVQKIVFNEDIVNDDVRDMFWKAGVPDSLCKKCTEAKNLRISKEQFKISKQRFDDFISDIDGEFRFLDQASIEEDACCMSDTFTLIGKSGKYYHFTTYDDRLELEP